jgi:hypothetical protein
VRNVDQLDEQRQQEAALAHLQATAGGRVVRWPRQRRKGQWLAYASLELLQPEVAHPAQGETNR